MDTSKLQGEPLGPGDVQWNGHFGLLWAWALGALGWGPGDSRQTCVVRKSVLRLKIECTCIKYVCVVGCGKGRKMGIFKPPKGTLKVCRIGS